MLTFENGRPMAVSIKRAAKELSLGRTKVYELINEGTLKTLKVGRRTLVCMSSVEALMARAS